MAGYGFEKAELDALERVVGDARAEPIALTLPLLKHITNDFSNENMIGLGGYSAVYLGTLPNGSRIAVKRHSKSDSDYKDAYSIEVCNTVDAAHKNVLRLIGYCSHTEIELVEYNGKYVLAEATERWICLEYVPNGTLREYITDGRLDWSKRYRILKGICDGLRHLHDKVRIIHRDIKPENILLEDNLVPKLYNFGISMHLDEVEDFDYIENLIGTVGYLAPEAFYGHHISFRTDIYALGVTIIELLTGQKIFQQSVEQVLRMLRRRLVHEGAFSSWENKYQQVRTCLEIWYNCTDEDPDKRPTALDIIHRLDETESANYSSSSGHAPLLWQSGDDESDLSDTVTTEPKPKSTPPSDEQLADLDTHGEMSTQEHDKSDIVSKLPASVDLSKVKFLEELDALERVVGDARAEQMALTLPLLKHITNDFSEENIIGWGGSAVVYLGTLPNGSRIAVKKLVQTHDESAFSNEVIITKKAAHQNIVRLIGYCSNTEDILAKHKGRHILAEVSERLICLEYVPNETLDRHITDKFPGRLNWNQRYQILKGICQALSYLHEEVRVIHRDIKPGNILLDDNFVPKLFDFGLSICLGQGEALFISDRIVGTIAYLAPEAMDGNFSFKSDIYALGITISDLLTGSKDYDSVLSVDQALTELRKRLVKGGAFSSWENKYQQVRTCLEIGYNCIDKDPNKRPTALEIIQLLDETERTNDSGHAPPLWQMLDLYTDTQSGDEESDLSDTDTAELDTHGETSAQEHDKPDTVSKLPASADLSKLKFLEEITDEFSHKRIVGKDGTFTGSHKAFVYKGDILHQTMIAVKRLIGVEIPAEKFKREAEQFMSLDHKNIVKVAGYCHDESNKRQKLVRFKGKQLPQVFNGPEQLLCYEYVHNGSLREYLTGQGSREIDWHMRYKLIKGTCEGLHYLHKGGGDCPIVHLNLSPSNVLLDENNIPRIRGFDFSKLIGEKNTKSLVLKLNGPIAYLPPDFFHSKGTDLKYLATVDIYSLGLMILEIATRQEIKGNHGILIKSIEENWREESQIASLYTSLERDKLWQVKLCIDIGLDCVKSKPEKRPTAGSIMLWLDKGSKPVPVPRAGAGGVPRPPVRTNILPADDHIQEKEKRTGFMKLFGRK